MRRGIASGTTRTLGALDRVLPLVTATAVPVAATVAQPGLQATSTEAAVAGETLPTGTAPVAAQAPAAAAAAATARARRRLYRVVLGFEKTSAATQEMLRRFLTAEGSQRRRHRRFLRAGMTYASERKLVVGRWPGSGPYVRQLHCKATLLCFLVRRRRGRRGTRRGGLNELPLA